MDFWEIVNLALAKKAGVIPCTAVAIDGENAAVSVEIGGTKSFSATRTPSNSNQRLVWSSSNTAVATIDASGVLTAVAYGQTTVTVQCGSYSATRTVNVVQTVDLSDHITVCNYAGIDGNGNYLYNTSDVKSLGVIPYSLDLLKVAPGRTVTVSLSDNDQNATFTNIHIVKAAEGEEIALEDKRESNNQYFIKNISVVAQSGEIHKKTQNASNAWGFWGTNSYSWTNSGTEDAYVIFVLQDVGSCWKSADNPQTAAAAWAESYLSIVIS